MPRHVPFFPPRDSRVKGIGNRPNATTVLRLLAFSKLGITAGIVDTLRVVNCTGNPRSCLKVEGFVSRDRSSRPARACSFSTHRLNPMVPHWLLSFLPISALTVSNLDRQRSWGHSRIYHVTQSRTGGVHRRGQYTGTGPVVLKLERRVLSLHYVGDPMYHSVSTPTTSYCAIGHLFVP